MSASLDYQRAVRDALSEASFFTTYGSAYALQIAARHAQEIARVPAAPGTDPRTLPFAQEALAAIAQGGYAEALARIACLLARHGEPVLLARLAVKEALIEDYRDLLPAVERDEWRRIRGEQEIIVRYEPERALATLPQLLADARDRQRLMALVSALVADDRFRALPPTATQKQMLARIEDVLGAPVRRAAPSRKATTPPRKRPPARRAPPPTH